MLKQFKPYLQTNSSFTEEPDINSPSRFRPNPPKAMAVWMKPVLVCEVSFTEMTRDGVMRHPSFEGMRMDKKSKDVKREKVKHTKEVVPVKKGKAGKMLKPAGKRERKTLLNPSEATQVRAINGHELKFNNLDKLYWPKEKIAKRDMLNYYYQVAPYILPYLKDRPQSMNRHPMELPQKFLF
jgi:bifunctional non-homologous end joining protein LigD